MNMRTLLCTSPNMYTYIYVCTYIYAYTCIKSADMHAFMGGHAWMAIRVLPFFNNHMPEILHDSLARAEPLSLSLFNKVFKLQTLFL